MKLTPVEFELLHYFALHVGKVIGITAIARDVWGHREPLQTATYRVHVSTLRRKLAACDSTVAIRAVHGIGYVLETSSG